MEITPVNSFRERECNIFHLISEGRPGRNGAEESVPFHLQPRSGAP